MRRTIETIALMIVTCAAASAQVVQTELRDGATDSWGQYFTPQHQTTFSGRITGIEVTKETGSPDSQVTVLVKNKRNGGTAVVEVGPEWFVDRQEAKIHQGDEVQVTGSKVMVDGHGVIIASMLRVNGQGGPVLALRRLNGTAYWLNNKNRVASSDTTTAAKTTANELPITAPTNPHFPPPVIQMNNGLVNIDTGAGYWYPYNTNYTVGNYTNVVTGPYPYVVGPTVNRNGFATYMPHF